MGIDWDKAVLGPTVGVFGETATYRPVAGAAFDIEGVYDEAYRDVTLLDAATGITTEIPVLGVRLAAFPAGAPPVQNDQLFIKSVGSTFIVKEVRNDGHGWAKLMLNFVSTP